MNEIIELIKEREIGKCVENASMKKYTTYKVGGIARCIVYPKDTKKLVSLLKYLKNYSTFSYLVFYLINNLSN